MRGQHASFLIPLPARFGVLALLVGLLAGCDRKTASCGPRCGTKPVSPGAAIDGFSRIVLEDCAAQLDPEGRENLGRVRAASQRMGQLIDDLLQLSRLTLSEMRRAPVDLSAPARTVADDLQRMELERHVEFVIEPDLIAGLPSSLRTSKINNQQSEIRVRINYSL